MSETRTRSTRRCRNSWRRLDYEARSAPSGQQRVRLVLCSLRASDEHPNPYPEAKERDGAELLAKARHDLFTSRKGSAYRYMPALMPFRAKTFLARHKDAVDLRVEARNISNIVTNDLRCFWRYNRSMPMSSAKCMVPVRSSSFMCPLAPASSPRDIQLRRRAAFYRRRCRVWSAGTG